MSRTSLCRKIVLCLFVFLGVVFSSQVHAQLGVSVTVVSGQPTDINPGDVTELQIVLSNSSTLAPLVDVQFSNSLPGTLPDGLTVASAPTYTCFDPASGTTSAGVGSLSASSGSQSISLLGGVVPQAVGADIGTCQIVLPVTAGTSDGSLNTLTYAIAGGSVTANEGVVPVSNIGGVSQSINVLAIQQPNLSMSFSNNVVVLGGAPSRLTFSVSNPNSGVAIEGFDITNTFPLAGGSPLIEVASTPNATVSCSGGVSPSFTVGSGDSTVTATGGTLAPNGSCTFGVDIIAVQTNGLFQTFFFTNRIDATTGFTNDLGISAASDATASFRTRSPLSVSHDFPASSLAGDGVSTADFTIEWQNTGLTPLTVSSFTNDPFDGSAASGTVFGLTLVGVPNIDCPGAGGVDGALSLTAGNQGFTLSSPATIAAGGDCTITGSFTGTPQVPNEVISFTNLIDNGDYTLPSGIIAQTASSSILVAEELRVTFLSPTPDNPAAGSPVQYRARIQNFSATPVSDLQINDSLPPGQTFLTGVIGGMNFSPVISGAGCGALTNNSALNDNLVALEIATVPAMISGTQAGQCVVTYYVQTNPDASAGSSVTNVIAPGDVTDGGLFTNGSSSNTVSSNITATLELDKSFSPSGPLPENTVSRLRVNISNFSVNPIAGFGLVDNLPASNSGTGQMVLADPPNFSTTCGTPTSVSAVNGATSVSFDGGVVPARAASGTGSAGTCFFEVDIVAPAGIYNNVATSQATETLANGTPRPIGPIDSNTEQIVYNSSLSASKGFAPTAVATGGVSRVTVTLSNLASLALNDVTVTDPLPANMVLANPVNPSTTCAGMGVIVGNPGDSTVSFAGGVLPGNATCTVLFDVIATGGTDITNTIPPGNITAGGGVENQTAVSAILELDPPTPVLLSKAFSPSTLSAPGQISQLTINVTAGAVTDLTNISFTDYFTVDGTSGAALNGSQLAPSPNAVTDCPGGVVTAQPNATSLSLTGANLSAGDACSITVDVTTQVSVGITNTIPIGAVSTDQGLTNPGPATTSLTTGLNLGVNKSFSPNTIAPGERSRLTITFFNPAPNPAANISVSDVFPVGIDIAPGPNVSSTCSGVSVTPQFGAGAGGADVLAISSGNLPAGSATSPSECTVEIDVTSTTAGLFTNTINIGDVTADVGGVAISNSEPASDVLRVLPPLTVTKAFEGQTLDTVNPNGFSVGTASAMVGEDATLTIRLSNSSAEPITGVSFNDVFPTGLFVATTPSASTSCVGGVITASGSASDISLTGATIPANGSCDVSVSVVSNIVDSYVNTLPAGAVTSFEGVTNLEPTSAELIISDPPTVAKEFSPVVIGAGGVSTLTIFLGNNNDVAANLTSTFTDALPTAPGNMVVASPNNLDGTCPGSVSASPGANSISYSNGSVIPAGGCTIVVDVTANTTGAYNNSIPVGELETSLGDNPEAANATLEVSPLGFVSGRVFADNNVTPNGVFDAGTDNPLSGQTIELRSGGNCAGALVANDITDSAGNYVFTQLAAGTYSVCQLSQPSNTVNGTATAGGIIASNGSTGTPGVASNPTATSSQIVNIVLNGDGASSEISGSVGNDFAEVIPSSLSGTVFMDVNNNGIQNGADTGFFNESIELLNGGVVVDTVSTDSDGNYSFTGLLPGTYSIRQPNQPTNTVGGITTAGAVGNGGISGTATAPTTLPSEINGIILPPNTVSDGNDFAELSNSRTVLGTVFVDLDVNSLFTSGDFGLGGVAINLTGTDENGTAVNETVFTDPDGNYTFTDLPAGIYAVTQPDQPDGTVNALPVVGSTGGTANNPTPTSSEITNIDLTGTNMISAGNNFPETLGATPDLTIEKTHSPVTFAEGSSDGTFTLTPSNVGSIDTADLITIVDTLPAGLSLASNATGTGWTCDGSAGATSFTCTTSDVITSGTVGNAITVPVQVANGLSGQLLTNVATISGGNEPSGLTGNNSDSDTVAITSSATVSGTVWFDLDSDNVFDVGVEQPLENWTAELLLNGQVVASAVTNSNGQYTITDVSPGDGYEIVFREPSTGEIFGGAVTNETGQTINNGTRDTGTSPNAGTNSGNPAGGVAQDGMLMGLTLLAGDNIVEQSLPLDPAGVVYNAVTRQPVAGAQVTITGPAGFDPANDLVGDQTVTTGTDGFYQFLLFPSAPSGVYTLEVTSYPGGFIPLPSTLIPVCDTGTALDVLAAPAPANIQAQTGPPPTTATLADPLACPTTTAGLNPANQASTQHFFTFDIDTSPGGSADVLNNHIPLDPADNSAINVIKTTPVVNTSVGRFVPYTITVNNTTSSPFNDLDVVDVIPAGFRLVEGSGSLDGVELQPTVNGNNLTWSDIDLPADGSLEFRLILIVGSGVDVGEFTNQAFASFNGSTISNIATATVRVVPDPVFDCSDLIGKVFDDQNANGYQDKGEPGIANVRVATVNGLLITTDEHGRFHVACADVPDAQRGSNFLLKLDERTLPSGYRVTTENPRVVRLTRGKLVKLNFGAAIHRVIRIDLNDAAFLSGEATLKDDWREELEGVVDVLRTGPAILRFGYELGDDGKKLAKKRIKNLTKTLKKTWRKNKCCHEVVIEHEFVSPLRKGDGR